MTNFIICICQLYSSVLEIHVKWFLNELLVSLIMSLLSSKSVDEKINKFVFNWLPSGDRAEKCLWKYNLNVIKIHYTQAKIYREVVTTCF